MRKAFVSSLIASAKKNRRIILLTGDLGYRYLEEFRDTFPDRFINVGVAESTLISVAAGLAVEGFYPFVYSIATFASLRAYEQIRNLIVLQNLNVKIVGTGGGLAYALAGVTHHAHEDIAVMRLLPNMIIANPSCPTETEHIVAELSTYKGSAYIRLERNPTKTFNKIAYKGIGKGYVISKGKDVVLLSTGTKLDLALELKDRLKQQNISVTVVSFPYISPLDTHLLASLLMHHSHFVTLEEHRIIGGFGSAIGEWILANGYRAKLLQLGLQETFSEISAGYSKLLEHHKFDTNSCLQRITAFIS